MTAERAGGPDYRKLMQKVERIVSTIERSAKNGKTIHTVAEAILGELRSELGVYGARLYRRQGANYVLQATLGDARELPRGLEIPAAYPPIVALLENGTLFMDDGGPGADPGLENFLGVERFAAIEVGSEEYLLAFNIATGTERDDVLYSLGILRHAINSKIREQRMEGVFSQARKIQASILPRRAPAFDGFDIAGRADAMEQVGGDFFDFIPLTDKILGLAIADVSGHGLPAALQVRDIYVGLRMGMARDFKIVRTVERLNAIIHQSTLTSRFVSLFYGELELNGVFIYVNAGHPAPFHLTAAGEVTWLEAGGPVLGPIPGASYDRGFVTMKPGDLLVLTTDGIIETGSKKRQDGSREEFGPDRLLEVARRHRDKSAAEIVAAIFEAVEKWSPGRAAKDDRTVVVVRYPVVAPAALRAP
jgi:sigma-B regulation protein RsbU (phosphoserine phosphatase)